MYTFIDGGHIKHTPPCLSMKFCIICCLLCPCEHG